METACFRFGMIAPVIQGTFPDASEAAYYRRVTRDAVTLPNGQTYQYSPDTLERWASLYRRHGMDGLLPKARKDKGGSRSIDAEAAEEIRRLFSDFPGINGVAVHRILVEDGFLPATVSVRAVQRFIRENNLKKPREGSVRERRAFEKSRFGQLWQADTAYLPYITDASGKSRRTCAIMIIDEGRRRCLWSPGCPVFRSRKFFRERPALLYPGLPWHRGGPCACPRWRGERQSGAKLSHT